MVGALLLVPGEAVARLSVQQQTAVNAITAAANKYGLDPAALIAVAQVESGLNPSAVGDSGHAFGLFQFNNAGGVITGQANPERYLNPQFNAMEAARHIAKIPGARGSKGAAAVKLIVNRFERPANPRAEINKALANYAGARSYISTPVASQGSREHPNASLAPVDATGLTNNGSPQNALQALTSYAMQGSIPGQATGNQNILNLLALPGDDSTQAVTPSGNSMNVSLNASGAAQGAANAAGGAAGNVVKAAQQYMGTPYKYGGADPKTGFDCSGFVQYLYKQQGIDLPRTTYQQVKVGQQVSRDQLQPGDILFFNTTGPNSHEGLYIGDGQFIQAPHTGDKVKISSLTDPYYSKRLSQARRVA